MLFTYILLIICIHKVNLWKLHGIIDLIASLQRASPKNEICSLLKRRQCEKIWFWHTISSTWIFLHPSAKLWSLRAFIKIEKINRKKKKKENSVVFNQTCFDNDLLPKYTYIHIYLFNSPSGLFYFGWIQLSFSWQ